MAKALICRRKKKKPCEDNNNCNKCQQQDAFCNFTWFFSSFSIFWGKASTWNCSPPEYCWKQSCDDFSHRPPPKPKGNFMVNFKSRNLPVANRGLCASELYGGQPRVGLCESERDNLDCFDSSSSLFSICYSFLSFLYAACFMWWVIGNPVLPSAACSWGCWKVSSEALSFWLRMN